MKHLLILPLISSCAMFNREPDYSDNLMRPSHNPYGNGYTVTMFCEDEYKENCFPWGVILDHKVESYDRVTYKVQYGSCVDKKKPIVWVNYWCVAIDYSVPRKNIKKPK